MGRTRKQSLALIAVLAVAGSLCHAEDQPGMVNVADFAGLESTTCGIQEAIDALPDEGGVVQIPPGVYRLQRSIVLRSRVTLRGAGSTTVLTRGKQAFGRLTKPARYSDTSVELSSTEGFQVGDEVMVAARKMIGNSSAHPIVQEVGPTRLTFAGPIRASGEEEVFEPSNEAWAINYFPFITTPGYKDPVEGVSVLDLTIDANIAENPGPQRSFTVSAVHLVSASDSLVRNVTIRGSVADGISLQAGHDNRVESCLVERCRRHGLHPGTGEHDSIFSGNISRYNGEDGLYFCYDTHGIIVTGNVMHDNRMGISGLGWGGKKGDRFNIVSNNICRNSRLWGIDASGGENNVISGNICINASQQSAGRYGGIRLEHTTDTLVIGNRSGNEGDDPKQGYGIVEHGESDRNQIIGNVCSGNLTADIAIVGPNTQVSGNSAEPKKWEKWPK